MTDSLYDWLLFLHIVAAMFWVGGTLVLAALATRVLREGEPGAIARYVGGLRIVGPLVMAPAPALMIGLGAWLVAESAAWDFGQRWLDVAFGLFGAAFLVGALHQSRTAIAAERASTAGDHGEAARQLRRWAFGALAILLILVAATWDMVFRPGL